MESGITRQSRLSKHLGVLCLVALTFVLAAEAAADATSRFDKTTGTCRKFDTYDELMTEGFLLFKEKCKSCHSRKTSRKSSFLFSESKTPEAWNRVFYERYSKCARNGSWDSIAPSDIMKINDFLFRYGAGTADVETAGC